MGFRVVVLWVRLRDLNKGNPSGPSWELGVGFEFRV